MGKWRHKKMFSRSYWQFRKDETKVNNQFVDTEKDEIRKKNPEQSWSQLSEYFFPIIVSNI